MCIYSGIIAGTITSTTRGQPIIAIKVIGWPGPSCVWGAAPNPCISHPGGHQLPRKEGRAFHGHNAPRTIPTKVWLVLFSPLNGWNSLEALDSRISKEFDVRVSDGFWPVLGLLRLR